MHQRLRRYVLGVLGSMAVLGAVAGNLTTFIDFLDKISSKISVLGKTPQSVQLGSHWQAEVTYDWGDRYTESFKLTLDGDEVLGTASFLGIPRGIRDGKLSGNKLTFTTKIQEVLGNWDNPREAIHYYRGKVLDHEIRFVMQTEGGYNEHTPVEFTATTMPDTGVKSRR